MEDLLETGQVSVAFDLIFNLIFCHLCLPVDKLLIILFTIDIFAICKVTENQDVLGFIPQFLFLLTDINSNRAVASY